MANLNLQTANNDYHVGLSAYALMVINGLKVIGVPYQKLIERSLLHNINLQDPNWFVPLFTIQEFLALTSKYFQSKNTPPIFFQNLRLCNLGNTGKLIYSSPKLLPALQNLVKYDTYFCTNQSTELLINGTNATIRNKFIDASNKGGTIMEFIWLCMLKNLLTSVNKNEWEPFEVHFMNEKSLFGNQFVNADTGVKYNQDKTAIVFKSSLLKNKLVTNDNCFDSSVTNKALLQRPPIGLPQKIEHFFDHNVSEHLPTLRRMADYYGVSPATFKRHLGFENANYKNVTSRWRLLNSLSLLTNTTQSITEISDKLHYSNPANFIRAFKKWTGQTPMEFKQS